MIFSIGHSNSATGRVDSGERYFLLRPLGTLQEARSWKNSRCPTPFPVLFFFFWRSSPSIMDLPMELPTAWTFHPPSVYSTSGVSLMVSVTLSSCRPVLRSCGSYCHGHRCPWPVQKGDYYHDEKHFEIVGYDVRIVVVDVINTLIPFADGDEDRVGSQERLLKGVGRAQNARTSQTSMERTITNSDKGGPPPLSY